MSEKANAPVTVMRMAAAEAMMPPIEESPSRMLSSGEAQLSRASLMRESRNTS